MTSTRRRCSKGRRLTLPEFALSAYVVTVYVFSEQSQYVTVSTWAGVAMLGIAVLGTVRQRKFEVDSVIVSRCLFALYCAITAVGVLPRTLSPWTIVQLTMLLVGVLNICSAARSVQSVEIGCYIGTAILIANAVFEKRLVAGTERYANLLGNANVYAFALLIACIFAVRRLQLTAGHVRNRFLRPCLVILIVGCTQQIIVVTGSRKGMLSLAVVAMVALVGTYWLDNLTHALRIAVAALVLCAVLAAVSWATPYLGRFQGLVEVASGQTTAEESAAKRSFMASEAFELWLQKPVFGWGFDQFRYRSTLGEYSHSNVMELLANGGIVGVSLHYSAYFILFWKLVSCWRATSNRHRQLDLVWVALLLVVLIEWSVGAVQYESKFESILIAVTSVLLLQSHWCIRAEASRPAPAGLLGGGRKTSCVIAGRERQARLSSRRSRFAAIA